MSIEVKSEYQSVSVAEIKALLLFDIERYKYEYGDQKIIPDEYIAAEITLAEQKVYSYMLMNNKKPTDYAPDNVKAIIKELVVNRIKRNMIDHKILSSDVKTLEDSQVLKDNLVLIQGERDKRQIRKIILPEERGFSRWY